MISIAELENNFAKMKRFSLPGAGITRLAFSNEDWQARKFITELMKRDGLSVRIDGFGNIIGRREGSNPQAKPVICCSHIDSVPHGGNFDGVLGILGGIEAVKLMNENNFTNYHPLEIVVFMCEESSRFGIATLGSSAACGELDIKRMKTIEDSNGKSLYDILQQRGLNPADMNNTVKINHLKACVEMHIEQGKVLETMNIPIGVVTGIAAPTRFKVKLSGKADHSGATPMSLRQDALCAAAQIILEVEKTAACSDKTVVGTVGIVNVSPNVMNVIPGQVELGIDIRSIYAEAKKAVTEHIKQCIISVAKERNIETDFEFLTNEEPVTLDQSVINVIEKACVKHDTPYHLMPSGAGHDTMHLARYAPAGMIFIPCRNGISHNPAEWADMKYIAQGVEILWSALCDLTAETH